MYDDFCSSSDNPIWSGDRALFCVEGIRLNHRQPTKPRITFTVPSAGSHVELAILTILVKMEGMVLLGLDICMYTCTSSPSVECCKNMKGKKGRKKRKNNNLSLCDNTARERDGQTGFRVIAIAMTGHLRPYLYTHRTPPSPSDCF